MTECIETYESFDDMGLSDDLLRGIYSLGFEFPSKIQQLCLAAMPVIFCAHSLKQKIPFSEKRQRKDESHQ